MTVRFPTLKKLTEALKGSDRVKFLAVQTVFEEYSFNTQDKLRQNQLKQALKIPMAHAIGNPDNSRIPEIIRKYQSGGIPWTVIIDPAARVVYNDFHIKVAQAIALIELLTAKRK